MLQGAGFKDYVGEELGLFLAVFSNQVAKSVSGDANHNTGG